MEAQIAHRKRKETSEEAQGDHRGGPVDQGAKTASRAAKRCPKGVSRWSKESP